MEQYTRVAHILEYVRNQRLAAQLAIILCQYQNLPYSYRKASLA